MSELEHLLDTIARLKQDDAEHRGGTGPPVSILEILCLIERLALLTAPTPRHAKEVDLTDHFRRKTEREREREGNTVIPLKVDP